MSDTDQQVPLPDLNAADTPPINDVAYNEDDHAGSASRPQRRRRAAGQRCLL